MQWVLMLANPLLQVLLLAVLIKRNLRSTLPIFFNFLIFGAITSTLETLLRPRISDVHYFFFYWTVDALSMIVSLAVIYEVFILVLKPYSALIDFGKALFRWAVLFLALASIVTAIATSGSQVG